LAENFSLHHSVPTGSGGKSASHPRNIAAFSHGVKRPKREADHFPSSSAEVNNRWSYTSTQPHIFMAWRFVKYWLHLRNVLS